MPVQELIGDSWSNPFRIAPAPANRRKYSSPEPLRIDAIRSPSEVPHSALNEKYRYSHSGEIIASSIASDCVSLSRFSISGIFERSREEIGMSAIDCHIKRESIVQTLI